MLGAGHNTTVHEVQVAAVDQLHLTLGLDQLGHHLGCRGEAHPFALTAGGHRQSRGQMRLARTCFTRKMTGSLRVRYL